MKLTNNNNLLEPIYSSLKSYGKNYSGNIENTISVTTLIAPVKIRKLKQKYNDEIKEDISGMLWGLMGQAIHTILEKHASQSRGELIEQRFSTEFDGHTVTGQIDRYYEKILQDWKLCSVWEYIYGIKPDKIAQLNIYATMMKIAGYQVDKLQNVLFFRDFSLSKSRFDKNYPSNQIITMDVEYWPMDKTLEYIQNRLDIHKTIADCTNEERWMKPEKYAVYKNANKKATKLCDSESAAQEYIDNHKDAKKMRIEYRAGEYTRCQDYCLVSEFCDQNKDVKNDK